MSLSLEREKNIIIMISLDTVHQALHRENVIDMPSYRMLHFTNVLKYKSLYPLWRLYASLDHRPVLQSL